MADEPLSDRDVVERLTRARHALGEAAGASTEGDTALSSARTALAMLHAALVRIIVKNETPPKP